jgi:FdrA protein
MIEPELRNEHIARALADPQIAVLLFDVVLGYGSHENPAQVLVDGCEERRRSRSFGDGTEQDPQVLSRQRAILKPPASSSRRRTRTPRSLRVASGPCG